MAQNISKNAQRAGAHKLISRWGGTIRMSTVYRNGKLKHYAECSETKNTARRPKDLM